ncbi:hypothetical protein GGS26DRAFT_535554 [Hypomontagnella submonticulosa]|nr:hypothetical protein GGS26DRAFT_535554 [Hypomontagnella submonticulosa]
MPHSIPLNLFDADDTDSEKRIATVIQDLIDGSQKPASAARIIHETVVVDCRDAQASLDSVPDPSHEQLENGPQPDGWMKFAWDCLGKAAMKVPADHEGQDKLIALVQELRQLPKASIPWVAVGGITETALWDLTKENGYGGLAQWLWELDQGAFTGAQQVEADPSTATAYLNFSAFLSRLLASGVADTNRLNALLRPSPFATSSPISIVRDPRHYEPYASAAAQWILHAGNTLYELCENRILVEVGKQRFTRVLWESWKSKFEAIERENKFTKEARSIARQAVDAMDRLKNEGFDPTKSVVEKFGYIQPLEDGDEES